MFWILLHCWMQGLWESLRVQQMTKTFFCKYVRTFTKGELTDFTHKTAQKHEVHQLIIQSVTVHTIIKLGYVCHIIVLCVQYEIWPYLSEHCFKVGQVIKIGKELWEIGFGKAFILYLNRSTLIMILKRTSYNNFVSVFWQFIKKVHVCTAISTLVQKLSIMTITMLMKNANLESVKSCCGGWGSQQEMLQIQGETCITASKTHTKICAHNFIYIL